jgi:phage gpG-like protein
MQILFPDPIMARLRRLARIQDRPVSEIVRRAVEEALAKSSEPSGAERKIPVFRGGKMLCSPGELRDALYRDDSP